MKEAEHARLAEVLLPAVLAAGHLQLRHREAGVATERKADASPVTAADREAEVLLLEALSRFAPGVPVIAEESVAQDGVPEVGDAFFLVDPLDGTREYVKGLGEFTINVGFVEGGRPMFGLVYAPALSELYVTLGDSRAAAATVGPESGAVRLEDCGLRPIRVRESVPGALVALDSRSHRTAATEDLLAKLGVREVACMGSSIKFCVIARGDADLYPRLGPTSEWDTAAGHAVLAAAGGSVVTLDGAPLSYGKAEARYLNPNFIAWGRKPSSLG